jgi:hypothetical protein
VIDSEVNTTLTINNNLTIDKKLKEKANTGWNETEGNTGSGLIDTGDINVEDNITAIGNIVALAFEGSGGLDGIFAGNDTTGYESDNNVLIRLKNTSLLLINNIVNFTKEVCMDLNTGYNTANFNTGGGEIITGDINVEFCEEEIFNKVIIAEVVPPIAPPVTPEVPVQSRTETIVFACS